MASLDKKAFVRFGKSFGVGLVTFSFDLALLFFLTDVLNLQYLLSAGAAFILATSLNYLISRKHVFVGSARPAYAGYLFFIVIGGVGLVLVTTFMYVCVEIFGLYYLLSRVLVACLVGWWNYLMNLYVNFRVAGT